APAPPLRRPREFRRPPGWGALERWGRAFLTEGNPLNKLGAVSLIVGAIIVFKYAVDNQWIGPTGRVAIGFVAGGSLFAVGEAYARRGWHRFASGLVGAGNGVLFASVYFGQQQYELLPAGIAFLLYVLVTAAVVAQSLRYDALGLATWGLLGGYLTPVLASTGSGNYVFLANYLLILNSGVFAIAYRRNWQPLKWMAFALTVPYLAGWVYAYRTVPDPRRTQWLELRWLLPYLGAFFVYFAAIPTWRSLLRRERVDVFGQVLTVANGIAHFGLAYLVLHEEHRAWLGVVAVVAAALYLVISSRMASQPIVDTAGLRAFIASAAGFVLLATPFLVSGPAITLVWCAETVFLAWVCTRPRFAFLELHVLAMLGVICVRLVGYDDLLEPAWVDPQQRYIPLAQLDSLPPLAAALAFGFAARFLARVPRLHLPLPWVLGVGLFVLVTAVQGESFRLSRFLFAPHATAALQRLVEAGLLISLMCALWFGLVMRVVAAGIPWVATLAFTALLLLFSFEAVVWPGSYPHMREILGLGYGLFWLHAGVILMAPLVFLLAQLYRQAPERALGWTRERWQFVCLAAAVVVSMLLLRREVFAITHAPPVADLFAAGAKLAAYRMLLSLAYALLAFGLYLNAVRTGSRLRLYAAYALYAVTAFKVYVFDLEAQHPLYRAFSLLAFAAILFVSSYFANRQRRTREAPRGGEREGLGHA
ncbi:MAG: DUF2339 domain-containing protein, partial [Deltaproteobacteria bacterium]